MPTMWSNSGGPVDDEKGKRDSTEVVPVDNRVMNPADLPNIAAMNISKSKIHIGNKNITQTIQHNDVINDLPLPQYLWSVVKNTTRAERLSCLFATLLVIICNILIIYFTVFAKPSEPEDISPDIWNISREMWLAHPYYDSDPLTTFAPARLVIIQHSVSAECYTFAECAAELRNMQEYYLETKNYDIPYNFAVGNDGRVYELRGWGIVGAHTLGYNLCSVGIGFIGDYREDKSTRVTQLQLTRTLMLLEDGVRRGYLHPEHIILAASDITNSASPGANLYQAIEQWDHFDRNGSRFRNMKCPDILEKLEGPTEWFIPREMWEAQPYQHNESSERYEPLKLVIIHHSLTPECHTFRDCAAAMRSMQDDYIANTSISTQYNFAIGNDGRVYELKGWGAVGAHTGDYDSCSVGIGFIGEYREDGSNLTEVTALQLERALMLVQEGVSHNRLHPSLSVVAAMDISDIDGPGENLHHAIQQWEYYDHEGARLRGMTCDQIHHDDSESTPVTEPNTTIDPETEQIITREMWGAEAYDFENWTLGGVAPRLIIILNSHTRECHSLEKCKLAIRDMQSFYLRIHGYCSPYNFAVGNDARIYEQRGWEIAGAHSGPYNHCSLGIGFIGSYNETQPTASQLNRVQTLLEQGVRDGHIHPDYFVVGAKDIRTIEVPDIHLYNAIQTWERYDHKASRLRDMNCSRVLAVLEEESQLPANSKLQDVTVERAQLVPKHLVPPSPAKTDQIGWLVARDEWGSHAINSSVIAAKYKPLRLVVILDTNSPECHLLEDCSAEMRQMQDYFLNTLLYDVPYNFAVGNDGRVYEQRGWGIAGAHSGPYNHCSLAIAFIGNYVEERTTVTESQLNRTLTLLDEGVRLGHLHPNYEVVGGKDIWYTVNPGVNLYNAIIKWKHFSHNSARLRDLTCDEITEVLSEL